MNATCPAEAVVVDNRADATANRVLPHADIRRTRTGYLIEVDLPGVNGADLSLEAEGDLLTLTAPARVEFDADKPGRRAEYASRRFVRLFRLGEDVDRTGISAALRHGVLRLELPLRTEAAPRKIPVRLDEAAAQPAG